MTTFTKAFADGYAALGLGDGHPVYPGFRPPEAQGKPCTTTIPTGGPPPSSLPVVRCTVQVNTYDPIPAVAEARLTAARNALHECTDLAVAGYAVLWIQAMQEPYRMPDDGVLAHYVFNLMITYRTE